MSGSAIFGFLVIALLSCALIFTWVRQRRNRELNAWVQNQTVIYECAVLVRQCMHPGGNWVDWSRRPGGGPRLLIRAGAIEVRAPQGNDAGQPGHLPARGHDQDVAGRGRLGWECPWPPRVHPPGRSRRDRRGRARSQPALRLLGSMGRSPPGRDPRRRSGVSSSSEPAAQSLVRRRCDGRRAGRWSPGGRRRPCLPATWRSSLAGTMTAAIRSPGQDQILREAGYP